MCVSRLDSQFPSLVLIKDRRVMQREKVIDPLRWTQFTPEDVLSPLAVNILSEGTNDIHILCKPTYLLLPVPSFIMHLLLTLKLALLSLTKQTT